MKKVDLDTAADIFRISPDAVRKRIERGSLHGTKESGRWKVFLPDSEPDKTGHFPDDPDRVVQVLKEHIETLKKENERQQRTIDALQKNQEQINYILALKEQKILELEAPKDQENDRRSWLQRIFNKGNT